MKNYNFCIFDCDGVILDSNKIKTQAFREALSSEPVDEVEKLIDFHISNGGVSRYEKFAYYFDAIKKSKNKESDIKQALCNFSSYVQSRLISCDLVPGVIEFLVRMKSLNIKCFVNSGSDEIELNKIFIERGIKNLFEEIKGSPNTKDFNTSQIISSVGEDKKGIFFGDSKSDYLSAKKYSLDFIFISGYSEWRNPKGRFTNQKENFLELLT